VYLDQSCFIDIHFFICVTLMSYYLAPSVKGFQTRFQQLMHETNYRSFIRGKVIVKSTVVSNATKNCWGREDGSLIIVPSTSNHHWLEPSLEYIFHRLFVNLFTVLTRTVLRCFYKNLCPSGKSFAGVLDVSLLPVGTKEHHQPVSTTRNGFHSQDVSVTDLVTAWKKGRVRDDAKTLPSTLFSIQRADVSYNTVYFTDT
jgi:hypothetical protein